MSPDNNDDREEFGTPFNPVSTVIEQDADENLDPDIVALNADEPEGEELEKDVDAQLALGDHVSKVGDAIDKIMDDEENDLQRKVADENLFRSSISHLGAGEPGGDKADKESSGEDIARLHVALKDPHHAQTGYVATQEDVNAIMNVAGESNNASTAKEAKAVAEHNDERQADLDQCCGTDPVNDASGDCEEGVGSVQDLNLDNLRDFGAVNEKKNRIATQNYDPDRERLTKDPIGPHIPKESPAGGIGEVPPTYEELEKNRDHWAVSYCDLNTEHKRVLGENEKLKKDRAKPSCCRPTVREDVYKLIDGERDYQIQGLTLTNHDDKDWVPNDWITLIEDYVFEGRDDTNEGYDAQMVSIRKIAALAVAAMEHILTPARV